MKMTAMKKLIKTEGKMGICRPEDVPEETRGNLVQWWVGVKENYYAGDNALRGTYGELMACMELTDKERDEIAIENDGMDVLATLAGKVDAQALMKDRDAILEMLGARVHLIELETGRWTMVLERYIMPCYRKGETLRWTETDIATEQGERMIAAYSNGELVGLLKEEKVPDGLRSALRAVATRL